MFTCTALAEDHTQINSCPLGFGGTTVSTFLIGWLRPDLICNLIVRQSLCNGVPHRLHPLVLQLISFCHKTTHRKAIINHRSLSLTSPELKYYSSIRITHYRHWPLSLTSFTDHHWHSLLTTLTNLHFWTPSRTILNEHHFITDRHYWPPSFIITGLLLQTVIAEFHQWTPSLILKE